MISIFMSLASIAHVLFGPYNEKYSTMMKSMMSIIDFSMGQQAYKDLECGNMVISKMFFVGFYFFVVCFAIQLATSIICQNFLVVR